MTNVHRVEVLYHGITDRFEYWQDQSASVRFFRRRASKDWVASIDGQVVTDTSIEDGRMARTVTMDTLRADNVEELITLVAMHEQVHGILDPASVWARDDTHCLEPSGLND